MNLRHGLTAATILLLTASAHALDCSGGADGGVDATGNQCNDPGQVVVAAAPVAAKLDVHASRPTAEALRNDGIAAYEHGHDARAIAYFRRAADGGDARSAEILTLMYRFGPRLFRTGVVVDPAESAKWAAVAAEARRRDATASIAAR